MTWELYYHVQDIWKTLLMTKFIEGGVSRTS